MKRKFPETRTFEREVETHVHTQSAQMRSQAPGGVRLNTFGALIKPFKFSAHNFPVFRFCVYLL